MSDARFAATREELLELAVKYQTLLAWRKEHAGGGAVAERAALRALSRAFPGALRELDSEPLDVLAARAEQLALAARGGPSEPWMHWMVAYHQVMRAALWLKPRVAGARQPPDERRAADLLAALAHSPVGSCKVPLDASFVARVHRPPLGRLNTVVFSVLGAAFQLDPDALWQRLFPSRRLARFTAHPVAGATASAQARATREGLPRAAAQPIGLPETRRRRLTRGIRPGMSSASTGLIFDLDGTLADTMPAHFAAWTRTCLAYGLSFPEARFYAMGGVPTSKIAHLLVEESGHALDPELVAREKEQAFVESLAGAGSVAPIAPIVAIARQNLGVAKMAIASGGRRALVERTLDILGIRDWFPVIVASEDTQRHKPEPDVFLEAARQLGLPPSACTVYEDTDIGIEAARRANMRWVDVRPLYVHLPR